MTWPEARAALPIIRREYQLSSRGPAFWAVAAAGTVLALWRASLPGATSALAAYHAWQVTVYGIAVLAILTGAAAAARDRRDASSELVLSKPLGSVPLLVVARFLGVCLSVLTIVAIMLAVASLRQALAGTPWRPAAYLHAFLRSLLPVALATALGFSLTIALANALAAGVAAVYWVCIPLARTFIPRAADMIPSQHWLLPALFTAALLALAATLHAKPVRGPNQKRPALGWATALLFAGALTVAFAFAFGGQDALVAREPVLSAIAGQRAIQYQRAPGFWLPDADGRLVGLSDFDGRPILLAFWGPADADSARVINLLGEAAREFRSAGLACIAICEDPDAATIAPFQRETDPGVVVLWDRGQHYGNGEPWSDSPLGIVYEITAVPTLFLLDRQRTLVARVEQHSLPGLREQLSNLVAPR